jgi:hypothetical protein
MECADSETLKVKSLEVRLSQEISQKNEAVGLLERVREALPSNALQRIFAELVDQVQESFKLELVKEETEKALMKQESEMRMVAKKDVMNTVKVAALRKEVER